MTWTSLRISAVSSSSFLPAKLCADGNLAHVESLRLGGEFRLHDLRHEIDAQDRADNPERIGDGIADRRILVLHHVERRLQRRGAGHRSRIDAKRVTDLDAVDVSQPERDSQAGEAGDQRQQIVFLADADHAFEELPAVEDANAVQEHDQAGEADRPDDLGFRRKGADGKADEQHRADPERKAGDADLADQIADADRQKRRQDRLASDDVACKIQHVVSPDGRIFD